MLRELGPSPRELPPTALSSDLLATLLAKLSNWYHGAHVESEGCFTLASKVTPEPNIQQLNATNKIPLAFSSTVIQRSNSLSDNCGDRVDLVVDLLY